MSGRFMRMKKVIVPMVTAAIMVSQLSGCSAVSQSELLKMINDHQSICIEIAEPTAEEQGEEQVYEWKELASLTNYQEFRMAFEDILGVTAFGEGGKNGSMYVDLEGNHTNNSTLYYAYSNQKFRDQLGDTDTNASLVEAVKKNYADINSDEEAKLAYINAYFNIFEDRETNYYNGNSALTRAEFLSGVYRAGNPVQELEEDGAFKEAVDPENNCEHTIFAQQMLDKSYLNLSEKSLNVQTFTGDITRAEAIYTLVKTFYGDKLEEVTGKEESFKDAKNGGNIALKQKFIEETKDKETKEKKTNYKDYWMSYELQYAINNADKGMPENLYKALVVAKQVGFITGAESRWDEAITKNEALNFLIKIYELEEVRTNADRGEGSADIVTSEDGEDGKFDNPLAGYTKTDESLVDYKVTITEELDTKLYVVKTSDIRKLDQEKAGGISPVEVGAHLKVTGKTSNNWYRVVWGQSEGYLPEDVLSSENPVPVEDNLSEVPADNGMSTEEVLDKFNEAMGNIDEAGVIPPAPDGEIEYFPIPDYDKTEPW